MITLKMTQNVVSTEFHIFTETLHFKETLSRCINASRVFQCSGCRIVQSKVSLISVVMVK